MPREAAAPEFGHLTPGPPVAPTSAMTRQFHQPVRLVPRRAKRIPREHAVSFTCFHLVHEPDEDSYFPIETSDPTNAMRHLVFKPRPL